MFFSSIGNHCISEGNNTTPAPSSSQLFFEIEQRKQHPVDRIQATRHTSASHMPTHLPAAWGTAADNNTYTTLKNL